MRYVKWITENIGWKLLAVAIAVLLWILVASEPELSTFVTVPLAYKNLPQDLEISGEPVNSISLELRGPAGELRSLGETGGLRPAVVVDMTAVQPGERTYPIGDGNVKLSRGVRLVRAIPSEARFEFERRRTRMVDVYPRFTGDGTNGYSVEHFTVEPNQLQVVGPASRVARISSVVTDRVDVSSVVGASEFRVNAFVEDPYVRFAGSPQVTVAVTMKRK
jgi:YbbR domain-containing protein